MIGGLSLFAVVTGFITSAFVARAQADERIAGKDPVMLRIAELEAQLTALRADLGLARSASEKPDAP